MRWERLATLLLILISLSFAASPAPLDLTFAVPVVAITVVIFLAFVSMIANSISNPRLEAWVKTEIRELAAGVILAFVVLTFFIGASSKDVSRAIIGKDNYISASTDVIKNWTSYSDSAFQTIIRAGAKLRVSATYSPYVSVPLWYVSVTYSTNPIAGIGILLGTLNVATQGLTTSIFLLEALRLLLLFVYATVGPILLPLSLVLRLIPFTRKVGNTLISVSLSAMLLLPFSILFANEFDKAIKPPQFNINLSVLDANPWAMVAMEPSCSSIPIRFILSLTDLGFAALVCLPLLAAVITAGAYPACVELVQNVVYPIIMVVFQVVNSVLLLAWEAAFTASLSSQYASDVFGQLYPFLSAVNDWVLLFYLDFILIAVIVVTGARSISAALGGDWYMSGIQRLI